MRGRQQNAGPRGILSTIILVLIFVVFAVAAQAVQGSTFLSDNSDDVLYATGKVVFASGALSWIALQLLFSRC